MGSTLLRVVLAAVFLAHGAQKVLAPWGGFAGLSLPFSLEVGPVAVPVIGLIELACGVLLLVGAFTRWVAPVLAIEQLLLAWPARAPNGFLLDWAAPPGRHGFEYDLVLTAALVSLAIGGGGPWSLDGLRRRSKEAAAAGLARIRAGRV